MKKLLLVFSLAMFTTTVQAQTTKTSNNWELGSVLDTAYSTEALELSNQDRGFQLRHLELTARGPLSRHFFAQVTGVLETHDGYLEKAIEEAWLETRTLPAGLSARIGRFASQIGYLNQQHPHADDFVNRPLLYRAFFGSQWSDDGIRLNITLPADFYWMIGAEAFRGNKLLGATEEALDNVGAFTLTTKLGADINRSHSWQLGLSCVRNWRIPHLGEIQEEEHDHDHDHDHDHGHDPIEHSHEHGSHSHGAEFSGKNTWLVDATWKWAPNGNNREQQLRITFEAAHVTDINKFATANDYHQAFSLASVWKFNQNWEIGARHDWLNLAVPHGEHFHRGRLNEASVMLAWKPTHMQSLRLQYTKQYDAINFENPAPHAVQLQYVLALGAHSAHAY